MLSKPIITACLSFFLASPVIAADSQCYGTVSNGRLENGFQLPSSGKNFTSYNSLGEILGRNYVHSSVSKIVVEAYQGVDRSMPNKVFVYGETGLKNGGRIRPHKTHRNGTSVDFMVPVLDETGKSVPLLTGLLEKFGYNIEFDSNGKYKNYTIDFDAIGEHLYQLDLAAKHHGSGLKLVIFDQPYLPKLFATQRGSYLKENIPFMKGKSWIRHDEHYHVDFNIPCKPLS
ncbi:MAG: hypothetical protein ACAH12_01535 [Methylophilaceae bacterium]